MSNQGPILALGALLLGGGALAWISMTSLSLIHI